MLPDLDLLTELVRQAAAEHLLPNFAVAVREHKSDGSVVTAADGAMQRQLTRELARRWPEYALLGEEMSEQEQARLIAAPGPGLWVLDPLDGTSNFAAGIPCFSVSLGLMVQGEVVLGLVYDPDRDECFSARKGHGAWLNGQALAAAPLDLPLKRCIAAVDFKRLSPGLARRLAEAPPYSSQRSFGSVALDWCWIAAGRFHVYLHGKQKLWDYAAGQLILAETGGHSETLHGEPVFRPSNTPRSAIAALDTTLFEQWRQWLRSG